MNKLGKGHIPNGPSDIDFNADSMGRQFTDAPMYPLPGSASNQNPRTPGDDNGIDTYGYRRYISRLWGGASNSNPAQVFYGGWLLNQGLLLINEDCQAMQIGSQSEAYAVRIYENGSSDYKVVTSDAPYVGLIKAPYYVAPAVISGTQHTMELVTFRRPPRQIFTTRAPLMYSYVSVVANTIVYFPTFGRKNIRITSNPGQVACTITYYTQNLNDRSFATPPSFGAAVQIKDTPIASENLSGANFYFTRDTVNSPGMFPAVRYDLFGVACNQTCSFQMQAFD